MISLCKQTHLWTGTSTKLRAKEKRRFRYMSPEKCQAWGHGEMRREEAPLHMLSGAVGPSLELKRIKYLLSSLENAREEMLKCI